MSAEVTASSGAQQPEAPAAFFLYGSLIDANVFEFKIELLLFEK